MGIELLVSWALGYALSKSADAAGNQLQQLLKDDPLIGELRQEAKEWADHLPDDLGEDLDARSVLGQMFQAEQAPDEYGDAQQRLSATLRQPEVPSTDEWFDALIERWDEVRHSLSVAEAHPFFTEDKELAEEQLHDLAERLHRVCQQSDEHFRNTITSAIKELENKVDQLLNLPWATPEDYFSNLLDDASLFRHSWEFVGREEVRDVLRSFALEEKGRVAILPGRGGIGKSKLLHAFSQEVLDSSEAPEIRFVKESAEVKETHGASLPKEGSLIIVLDDAHRRDQNELLALLQIVQQRNAQGLDTKLILSTRPYRTDTIHSTVLRNGFDSERIECLDPLESLSRDEMRELAREALGPGYEGLDDQLATVGEDSPLVVTVGGLLVSQERIDPRLLSEESEEFRSIVLERFQDLFSRSISDRVEPQETEGVLRLVAALSPVRPADNQFIEKAASYLDMTPGRFRTVLRELEEAGAFVRRGGLIRITPDVLSDDILHRACRTPEGTTTSFTNRVLDHFGDQAAERILQNLAEVNWRIRRTEGRSDLLDEIWESITDRYWEGDAQERIQILSQLKEVAYYLPHKMLRIVEDTLSVIPEDDGPIFAGRLKDQLADILQRVAYTVELLPRCIDLLWELVEHEDSPSPFSASNAFKALKELAKPDYKKPVSVQGEVLNAIETWIEDEELYGTISGPRFLDLLDQLLAKVVDEWRAEGHVVRGGAYVIRMTDRQRDLRNQAIETILCYGTAEHAGIRDALEAKDSLVKALQAPKPLLGVDISEEDRQAFETERLCALEALRELRDHWQDPIFDVELLRSLRWHAQNATSEQIRTQVAQLAGDISPDFDLRLAKSLMYSIDRRNPQEDEVPPGYENHSEDPEALRRQTAQEFVDRFPDPEVGAAELNQRLKELDGVVPDNSVHSNSKPLNPSLFLQLVASMDSAYATGVAQHLVEHPGGPLDSYVGSFIQEAGKNEEIDAPTLTMEALENGAGQSYSIAKNPQLWYEDAGEQDVDIGRQVLRADDRTTRRRALNSLDHSLEAPPEEKKALALQVNAGEDAELADKLFSVFSSRHGIGLDGASDGELRTLVQKLENVGRLDKHWVQEFLQAASERVPQAVFDLLLARLQRETDEIYSEYQAVPAALLEEHVGFGESLEGLAESQDYRDMLRQIRDLMLDQDQAYSVPDVFVAVSNGINEAGREVLREWLDNSSPDRLSAVLELIEDAPDVFVLENDDFIGLVLDAAYNLEGEHFDNAKSRLLWAAQSESRTRGPYQPAPKDARNQERGRELAKKHASDPLLSEFYAELAAAAEARIEEEMRRDEEFEI